MLLFFSLSLFSSSLSPLRLNNWVTPVAAAVGLTSSWELSMSHLGLILVKTSQFLIGTFLQIHSDIYIFFILSSVVPWLDKPTQVMKFNRKNGDNVSFVCSAKGFPLEVTWKVEKIKYDAVYATACISKIGKPVNPVRIYCFLARQ